MRCLRGGVGPNPESLADHARSSDVALEGVTCFPSRAVGEKYDHSLSTYEGCMEEAT